MAWQQFPVPLPGHGSIPIKIRWLAPPAKFMCPYRGNPFSSQSLKALGLGRRGNERACLTLILHALRYATGTTPLAKVLADLKVAFLQEK
jgi:hypothetical protein